MDWRPGAIAKGGAESIVELVRPYNDNVEVVSAVTRTLNSNAKPEFRRVS
jgi:hypothetical protein